MTTPAVTISMSDIRNETGAGTPISFSDWFVQHVAKRWDGPISMSAMRGKTCHPGNSVQFGTNYVNSENYATFIGTETYWTRHPSNGHVVIVTNGVTRWNALSSTAARGYVDVNGVRYYRGVLKESGPDWERYGLRWVEG